MYLLIVLLIVRTLLAAPRPPVRHLSYGSFRGAQSATAQSFYNIPYAAPPVGPLRFRPPQPPLNVTGKGIQDASRSSYPSSSCMVDLRNPLNFGARSSEDCLRLNVFTPANAKPGMKLPVYVHIFGSAFR
jgi:para-nitrobenzyl esterase